MSKKILLIGGGGHCKSVLDTILELNDYDEIGIVDKKENVGSTIMGIQVVGCDEDLPILINSGFKFAFVSMGSIGNPSKRINLFNQLNEIGYIIPNIIDLSAVVSRHATIEHGVYIGKNAVVNACAKIKRGAIINSGSIIEHDCQIGSFAHISPGAVLGGEVVVGQNTHIGINASIRQQLVIGPNSIIGIGSIVLSDVSCNTLAYGTPCKEVKEI
mgnify:CR=1 FL=1